MKRSLTRAAAIAVFVAVVGLFCGCDDSDFAVFRESNAPVISLEQKALPDIAGSWMEDGDRMFLGFKPSHIVKETGDIIERYEGIFDLPQLGKREHADASKMLRLIAYPVTGIERKYLFIRPIFPQEEEEDEEYRFPPDLHWLYEVEMKSDSAIVFWRISTETKPREEEGPVYFDDMKNDLLADKATRIEGEKGDSPVFFRRVDDVDF
jgi:hypothetical protein